jgi:TetR/AcrR family transcriptional regulator, tetracycline repressor protein
VAKVPGAGKAVTGGHLSRERVVAAALAVVDRDGLDGLTMRALGRELNVDPMAAYHHVPNKAAIIQGVVEAILSEIPVPGEDEAMAWPDGLRLIGREYRRVVLAHPNALPVVSTQPVLTPAGLRLIEAAAAILVRGGLTPVQALEAINGGAAIVIGSALVEAGVTPGTEPIEQAEIESAYGSLSPEEFPTISAVLAQAGSAGFNPSNQFEDLLDAFVRGLEARFAHRLDVGGS